MKGVITAVWPKEKMPFNQYGVADIIMDPSSIPSRMNVGRLYEQYYNAISRHVKYRITQAVAGRDLKSIRQDEIEKIWNIALGLTKIIGSEQYDYYLKASYEDKIEILQYTLDKEFQILYKFKKWNVEKPKEPYQVCLDVVGTEYEPPITQLNYMVNGVMKTTKEKVLLAPSYIILLGRTADNYLAVSSPKVNHFGFAIGISNNAKHNSVGRLNPVRTISETEGRLYVAYAKTPVGPAELSDRAKSIPTHKHIVRNILEAPNPTNIDKVVDRTIMPYGNDSAINLVNNILSSAGIELAYVHDDTVIHNEIKGVMKDEIEAFAKGLVSQDKEVSE